jgi:hypothetical protein
MTRIFRVALAVLVTVGLAAPTWAQTVTQTDIQRLQDTTYLAERDINALRSRDAGRASQLQTELDDLKDEVIYLKVKLRKDRTLSRTEFGDVQNRIESVRSRASGSYASNDTGSSRNGNYDSSRAGTNSDTRSSDTRVARPLPRGYVEVPAGTELVEGPDALLELATREDVDLVVVGTGGMVSLRPVLAALRAGKVVATANKETLVAGGHLVMPLARALAEARAASRFCCLRIWMSSRRAARTGRWIHFTFWKRTAFFTAGARPMTKPWPPFG